MAGGGIVGVQEGTTSLLLDLEVLHLCGSIGPFLFGLPRVLNAAVEPLDEAQDRQEPRRV